MGFLFRSNDFTNVLMRTPDSCPYAPSASLSFCTFLYLLALLIPCLSSGCCCLLPFDVRAVVNYSSWSVFTAASSRLTHHRSPLFNHLASTLVKNAPLLTAVRLQPLYSCVFLQNMFIILSLTSTLSLLYFSLSGGEILFSSDLRSLVGRLIHLSSQTEGLFANLKGPFLQTRIKTSLRPNYTFKEGRPLEILFSFRSRCNPCLTTNPESYFGVLLDRSYTCFS